MRHYSGTMKTILYLIVSRDSVLARFTLTDPTSMTYPSYITNELLTSLGRMVEGESDPHIDASIQSESDGRYFFRFSHSGVSETRR